MKTLKLFVVGILLVFATSSQAQLSVRVHIGTPPSWGPAGYSSVRYYYLPDVEAYYDVQNSMFIYQQGNTWVHRSSLPGLYKNYDLYGGYKVVMNDYHGNAPYANFREYKVKYAHGYRGRAQRNIGVRDDRNHQQFKAEDKRPGNGKAQMQGKKGNDQRNDKNKKDDRRGDNDNRK
jgi:hypothetical protein